MAKACRLHILLFIYLFMNRTLLLSIPLRIVLMVGVLFGALSVMVGQRVEVKAANDYPYPSASASNVDPWNFYYRNCTSYIAWRMNRDHGTTSSPYYFMNTMTGPNGTSGTWGNANTWDDTGNAIGFDVNSTPAVGSVAVWNSGTYGHVAYVESVNSDNTVNVSEYNYGVSLGYGTRNNVTADVYVHIHTVEDGIEGIQLTGDFTGDGKDDIAMASEIGATNELQWMIMDTVSTGDRFQSFTNWTNVNNVFGGRPTYSQFHVGDFNGDGKDDIAMASEIGTTDELQWMILETASTGDRFESFTNWTSINNVFGGRPSYFDHFVADVTGDGKADVVMTSEIGTTNELQWMVLETASTGDRFESFTNWTNVNNVFGGRPSYFDHFVADITGDGKADVIMASEIGTTNELQWMVLETASTGDRFTGFSIG